MELGANVECVHFSVHARMSFSKCTHTTLALNSTHIVAKCLGLAGTVSVSRFLALCPSVYLILQHALSWNPAQLHKWRCGMSINSVHYQISVHISRVGVAIHKRPKVGVVIQKWVWSNFRVY